ncbi:hypothetical protein ACIP5Y_38605 [Nocardia sp. NPDC088792]|uniref:hypothetical protein n=1 Tax=Nocardia sp. NPDC088792 TaxID=3364332 RepID=UPI0037FF7B91
MRILISTTPMEGVFAPVAPVAAALPPRGTKYWSRPRRNCWGGYARAAYRASRPDRTRPWQPPKR